MSAFVVIGVVALLMLVYIVAVLGVLPWFIYIPFVLLFALVFFSDKICTLGAMLKKTCCNTYYSKCAHPKADEKISASGKHGGKRI